MSLHRAAFLITLAAFVPVASAMDHGSMDMGSSNESAYAMKMYFHSSKTDYMLFRQWLPSAVNEFAAACIFCVALGMLDRLLAAFRGALEARWQYQLARADARVTLTDKLAYDGQAPELLDVLPSRRASWAAPFSLSVDPVRALLQGFQAFIGFVLMLAVMTFNLWFVLSCSIGIAVGTLLFGRYAGNGHSAALHC